MDRLRLTYVLVGVLVGVALAGAALGLWWTVAGTMGTLVGVVSSIRARR